MTIWVSYLIWRKQNGCAFPSAHPGPPRQSAFGTFNSVNLPDTSGSKRPLELALSMTSRMFLLPPLGTKNSSKSHTATLSATPLAKYEQKLTWTKRVRKHQRKSVNLLSENDTMFDTSYYSSIDCTHHLRLICISLSYLLLSSLILSYPIPTTAIIYGNRRHPTNKNSLKTMRWIQYKCSNRHEEHFRWCRTCMIFILSRWNPRPLMLYRKSTSSSAWEVMDTEPSSMKERRTRCSDFICLPPQARAAVMKMWEAPMRRWCCMNSRYRGTFWHRKEKDISDIEKLTVKTRRQYMFEVARPRNANV